MNHQNLITKNLKKGNSEAIDCAFKTYYKQLVTFAYTFLEGKEEAEDIVQDCFATLLHRRERWKEITDLRAYLFKMVQNKSLVHIRNKNYREQKSSLYSAYISCANFRGSEPEILTELLHNEDIRFVDRILSFVTPKRRIALQLVYLEENGYGKTAEKLDISLNTLKTTLRLAKRDIIAKIPTLLPLILLAII